MTDFDYLTLIFIIPLGLTIIEIAQGISLALRQRDKIKLGWLTPLLTLLLIFNTALILQDFWDTKEYIDTNYFTIVMCLIMSIAYYISASFAFPHNMKKHTSLDEWFLKNRKISLGLPVILGIFSSIFIFSEPTESSKQRDTIINIFSYITLVVLFSPMAIATFAKNQIVIRITMIIACLVYCLFIILSISGFGDN